MIGDLKKRASFARVVNYVNNPKKARLIDSKDVRLDDNATIARSMQGQADDKPGRKLKNPVYHISLDFAHEDTPKLTDDLMVEIAREYMRRMGITEHPIHCVPPYRQGTPASAYRSQQGGQ